MSLVNKNYWKIFVNAHVFQKICVLKQIQLKNLNTSVETKSDNLQTKLKCFVGDNERTKCKTGYYPGVESKDIKYQA